jgi:diguanylate cyclase (GGDEF)-like protein
MSRPMDKLPQELAPDSPFWRADILFALFMFVSACAAFAFASHDSGFVLLSHGWPTALFFLGFGIFTITVGYPNPGFGHVSFDRVAQVASILVLGPVDAAWINGLASLLYPWHRLFKNVPFRTVLMASLHNSGMMTLVVLGCGMLYSYLGGPIPLQVLDLKTAGLLLLLMLSMQLVNDLSMMVLMHLRGANVSKLLSVFSTGVELTSGLIAIIVALVFVRLETQVFAVLLVVLCLGMLVIKKYAHMRQHLEQLVDKRTEELRLKSIELEQQATHDKLTGLFNRRYADDYLQREIEATRRHDRDFTVALADIDHFKQINDRFSHAIGDRVLERISRILVERCRKTDVVARYGGEEFLLCFPDTNSEFAEQICGQIRKAVERTDWSDLAGDASADVRITVSFGIAEVGQDARRTSILSDADNRLYRAKHKGRNRVVA